MNVNVNLAKSTFKCFRTREALDAEAAFDGEDRFDITQRILGGWVNELCKKFSLYSCLSLPFDCTPATF